jgi:5-methyltetrahydrofolate--homocysteine methyltransferase
MDELCSGAEVTADDAVVLPSKGEPQRERQAARCGTVPTPRSSKRPSDLRPAPNIPQPPFWGSRVVGGISMEDVFQYLNERTLFSTQWQFVRSGVAPKEYERQMHEVAEPALRRLQQRCLDERILRPGVAYGFFPCLSEGDDLIILEADRALERLRFTFPRQEDADGLCLSDYFVPKSSGQTDVVAFMAVTMGAEISRRTKELYEQGQYQDYLFLHGLGVESAEALAEYFHRRLREIWGISADDSPDIRKLFKKHYRGCRYSFGYPACPALEDQAKLFTLLQPERIGLTLTESFQLEPEQSTTALIVHHPQAKYFNVA